MNKLTEEEIKFLGKVLFFLKFRPRTRKEAEFYLVKKGSSLRVVKKIIRWLENYSLVNDYQFIDWFVRSRAKNNPKSFCQIKYELRKLGIDSDLINNFINNSNSKEEDFAYTAGKKYWKRISHLSQNQSYKKFIAFMKRRGFSISLAKKIFSNLIKDEDNSKI